MNDLPEAPRKYVCRECRETCLEPLSAANPFDPADTICGCPTCKSAESLVWACQFEGCKAEVSYGTPGGYGFRYFSSCWKHSPLNQANSQGKTEEQRSCDEVVAEHSPVGLTHND